jgi:hypothetical protein
MSAGVHDADITSRIIFGTDFAGVREARLFFDRKGVELGAKHHGRARAVLQEGDDSSSTNLFGDRISEITETACQLRRSLGFMRREFRILV